MPFSMDMTSENITYGMPENPASLGYILFAPCASNRSYALIHSTKSVNPVDFGRINPRPSDCAPAIPL
jgi:hypothetical protein